MTKIIPTSRCLALGLTLAFLAGLAQVAMPIARAQNQIGMLWVTGKVKVNGQPAATGDTVSAGSTVETAKISSAVVILGKLGQVEALPETRMTLRYDASSISIQLDSGRVRVATGEGVTATVESRCK